MEKLVVISFNLGGKKVLSPLKKSKKNFPGIHYIDQTKMGFKFLMILIKVLIISTNYKLKIKKLLFHEILYLVISFFN